MKVTVCSFRILCLQSTAYDSNNMLISSYICVNTLMTNEATTSLPVATPPSPSLQSGQPPLDHPFAHQQTSDAFFHFLIILIKLPACVRSLRPAWYRSTVQLECVDGCNETGRTNRSVRHSSCWMDTSCNVMRIISNSGNVLDFSDSLCL